MVQNMTKKNKKVETEEIQDDLTTDSSESTDNTEQTDSVSETDRLTAELQEQKDKYIRLYAEFDNFRRRTAKEKIETIMNASENLIKELIPVLDDFERADKAMENSTDLSAIKEGIDLVYHKFFKTLSAKGLKPMESKDTDFDVELHECITQFAAGDEKKGKVIDEIEKGYYLNDKVIRYAKVVVGN